MDRQLPLRMSRLVRSFRRQRRRHELGTSMERAERDRLGKCSAGRHDLHRSWFVRCADDRQEWYGFGPHYRSRGSGYAHWRSELFVDYL